MAKTKWIVPVVALVLCAVSLIGAGYAQYASSLNDNEAATVNNHYGTVTMSGTPGHYTLTYEDTDADEVILTVRVAGLSSDYSPGTVLDLWLGETSATSEFGSRYVATVSDSVLTSLVRPLSGSESVYTDSDAEYTVTCSAGTVSVTKGGQPVAVFGKNFVDGSAVYAVSLSGDTVTGVSRVITATGTAGTYSFRDGGSGYAVTCSGSLVSSAVRSEVISAAVDGYGIAEFGAKVVGLAQNSWQQALMLRCGGADADIGSYTVNAKFYSIEPESHTAM